VKEGSALQGPSGSTYLNNRKRIIWIDKIARPKGKIKESFAIDSTIDIVDMISQYPGSGVRGGSKVE
jgi:hypothetical protein